MDRHSSIGLGIAGLAVGIVRVGVTFGPPNRKVSRAQAQRLGPTG